MLFAKITARICICKISNIGKLQYSSPVCELFSGSGIFFQILHLNLWSWRKDAYMVNSVHRFNIFTFTRLTWARSVNFPWDMGHASLETHECSQMGRDSLVIFWKGLNFATVPFTSLARQEAFWAVARSREFSMRLKMFKRFVNASPAQHFTYH